MVVRRLFAARLYNAPLERRVAAAMRPLRGAGRASHRVSRCADRALPMCQAVLGRHLTPRLGASSSSEPGSTLEKAADDPVGGRYRQRELPPAATRDVFTSSMRRQV